MNAALDFLLKLGPARIAAMGVVTLALMGFFAFVIVRVSQPTMGVLYSDLSPQDAASILKDLDAKAVKYETRADGQTILAPRADLARIRMDFATKGLPSGGGVGYEIFDKGDAFSSTSFVQNINHLRAMEGELARTIGSLSRVATARVHLVIPERRLFERDREPPRASIVLKLRGDLDAMQIRAIRHLVASAVENLKPEQISIVDERGRLLADGAKADAALTGALADEKQAALEGRLKMQVEDIVAGIVGSGRAKIQVAAELDLNRIENRSESYDPESRVVRSSQNRTESQSTANPDGAVSVGNELPGANANQGSGAGRDATSKNEEIVNYEISRTTKTEIVEGGRLKRLSVAVLVDGIYTKAANGEATYQARPQEDLDRIGALVRTAMGFDAKRGDQVEIVNLRFADAPQTVDLKEPSLMASLLSPTKEDILRLIELGVIAILTLIVLLSVVKPLVKRVLGTPGGGKRRGGGGGGDGGGMAALTSAPNIVNGVDINQAVKESPAGRMIDMANIKGQVQAKSIERVGELVQNAPQETVSVLREWIHERG